MDTTPAAGGDPREFFQDFFNEWGSKYGPDAFTGAGMAFLSERELATMLRLTGNIAGAKVLDAGCGVGRISRALREAGATVSAFDQAPNMVETTRASGQDDVQLASLGDQLPYEDDSFDVAVSLRVLKYLADWKPALDEFARVVRPGGRLVIEVSNAASFARFGYKGQPVRLVRRNEVTGWLRDAGFTVSDVVAISHLPHPAFAGASKPGVRWNLTRALQRATESVLGPVGARSWILGATRTR